MGLGLGYLWVHSQPTTGIKGHIPLHWVLVFFHIVKQALIPIWAEIEINFWEVINS